MFRPRWKGSSRRSWPLSTLTDIAGRKRLLWLSLERQYQIFKVIYAEMLPVRATVKPHEDGHQIGCNSNNTPISHQGLSIELWSQHKTNQEFQPLLKKQLYDFPTASLCALQPVSLLRHHLQHVVQHVDLVFKLIFLSGQSIESLLKSVAVLRPHSFTVLHLFGAIFHKETRGVAFCWSRLLARGCWFPKKTTKKTNSIQMIFHNPWKIQFKMIFHNPWKVSQGGKEEETPAYLPDVPDLLTRRRETLSAAWTMHRMPTERRSSR